MWALASAAHRCSASTDRGGRQEWARSQRRRCGTRHSCSWSRPSPGGTCTRRSNRRCHGHCSARHRSTGRRSRRRPWRTPHRSAAVWVQASVCWAPGSALGSASSRSPGRTGCTLATPSRQSLAARSGSAVAAWVCCQGWDRNRGRSRNTSRTWFWSGPSPGGIRSARSSRRCHGRCTWWRPSTRIGGLLCLWGSPSCALRWAQASSARNTGQRRWPARRSPRQQSCGFGRSWRQKGGGASFACRSHGSTDERCAGGAARERRFRPSGVR